MNKIKNIITYIIVCIIIFASFKMPEILFELKDYDIGVAVYDKAKEKGKIDVEANEIYLVKAIHDIESEYSTVAISNNSKVIEVMSNSEGFENIDKELLKLKEYNILSNLEVKKDEEYNIAVINKFYDGIDNSYILNNIFLELNDYEYNLGIESKTGKILYIVLKKDDLGINKKEIMENYIKYLDLYIIDDWNFEEGKLVSQKANLSVSLIEIEENYILSIHSSNTRAFDVYEYGKIIR